MLSVYRLPHKIKGEKIIDVVRRDLVILIKRFLLCLILLVLPGLMLILLLNIHPDILQGQTSFPLLVLSSSAYFIFIWLFFFFNFIDYYLDIWIITSERIIDVQQHGFFSRVIAEHRLDRIQDVTSEVHGILPTVFKYGEVYVQTAGTKERFKFHQVPQPEAVRNTIIRLAEICRHKQKEPAPENCQPADGVEHLANGQSDGSKSV